MSGEKNNDWLNKLIEKNAFVIIVAILGLATVWGRFNIRVNALEKRVDKYSKLVERVIVLEEREKHLEEDVSEIKQDVKEVKKKVNTLN